MSTNNTRRHKQVLLLVETSRQYGRDIIAGVTRYVKEHGTWNIYFEDRGLNEKAQTHYANWDGIIARSASDDVANALKAWGGPLVELLHTDDTTRFPDVMGDSATISQMAVEHFLERRIRNFAYFSLFNTWWSTTRCELFRRILNDRGFDCHVFQTPTENVSAHPSPLIYWNRNVAKSLPQWLKSLPKPVGLLVTTDSYAMYVYEACYSLGIAIPEDVAILGVDNDHVFCHALNPPLSSIDQNSQQVGYQAAILLDRKMNGKRVTSHSIFTPPSYVVARKSTDIIHIEDAVVVQAIRFIRENLSSTLTVDLLSKELRLSRSTLERRFRAALGRSPWEEICRVQLDRAKELLRETNLPLELIASKTGFVETGYFIRTFKRKWGQTPLQYRSQFQ